MNLLCLDYKPTFHKSRLVFFWDSCHITLERTQEAGSVYVLKEAPRKLKNDNFTKKQKAFD